MFKSVITHQTHCYRFKCKQCKTIRLLYNIYIINGTRITIIKGKEQKIIWPQKYFYNMLKKKNGTAVFLFLFKVNLFRISKLQIKFNKNLFPNVYIIKITTRFRYKFSTDDSIESLVNRLSYVIKLIAMAAIRVTLNFVLSV